MEHYLSVNRYLRGIYGCKVYKLALDGGFTCPNRDGTVGDKGCIFCSGSGSGDFAISAETDIFAAIEKAKMTVAGKIKTDGKYIAYFQSFTGTYAPAERLWDIYSRTIAHPDVAILSVATRPDCVDDDVIAVIRRLNKIKPVWVELGLQTIHKRTADYIRRGYELDVFDDAVKRLKNAGIPVIVHMIIGLPGESDEMIWQTAEYIGRSGADGIKLQLLHVLKGTDLADDYEAGCFEIVTLEHYIELLEGCIKRIPPEMVVHRLTGDGAKRDLIAPVWSADKKRVLNAINRAFDRDEIIQGSLFSCK